MLAVELPEEGAAQGQLDVLQLEGGEEGRYTVPAAAAVAVPPARPHCAGLLARVVGTQLCVAPLHLRDRGSGVGTEGAREEAACVARHEPQVRELWGAVGGQSRGGGGIAKGRDDCPPDSPLNDATTALTSASTRSLPASVDASPVYSCT